MKPNFMALKKTKMTMLAFGALIVVIGHAGTAFAQQRPLKLYEFDQALARTREAERAQLRPNPVFQRGGAKDTPMLGRLFTSSELQEARKHNTVAYEAAMKMGLFDSDVQKHLGIDHIDVVSQYDRLEVYLRDGSHYLRFYLTPLSFIENTVIELAESDYDRDRSLNIRFDVDPQHSEKVINGNRPQLVYLRIGQGTPADSTVIQKTALVSLDSIVDTQRIFSESFATRYRKDAVIERSLKERFKAKPLNAKKLPHLCVHFYRYY